jgi:hypothetical protein
MVIIAVVLPARRTRRELESPLISKNRSTFFAIIDYRSQADDHPVSDLNHKI